MKHNDDKTRPLTLGDFSRDSQVILRFINLLRTVTLQKIFPSLALSISRFVLAENSTDQ